MVLTKPLFYAVAGLVALTTNAAPLDKRIAQTISDSTQQWVQACTAAGGADKCGTTSQTAFMTLLAGAGDCDQQNAADDMVNLAKTLNNNAKMISLAQVFAQQPRNSPNKLSVNYCQQQPKNAELQGLFQCQFQGVDPQTFTNNVKVGGQGTMPLGLNAPLNPAGSCKANPQGGIAAGSQLVALTQDPGVDNNVGAGSGNSTSGASNVGASSNSTDSSAGGSSSDSGSSGSNAGGDTGSPSGSGNSSDTGSTEPSSSDAGSDGTPVTVTATVTVPSGADATAAAGGAAPTNSASADSADGNGSSAGSPQSGSDSGSTGSASASATASSASASVSADGAAPNGSFQLQNGKDAQALNTKFASLTDSSSCNEGDQACVDNGFAQCVGGKFQTTQCAAGTQCFALPLVNKAGTSIACTTQSDATSRIQATGASGGLTGA